MGRSANRTGSIRLTGSAKCNPAAPRSASACHGSCVPVVRTPAASPAAAPPHVRTPPCSEDSSGFQAGLLDGAWGRRASQSRRPWVAWRSPWTRSSAPGSKSEKTSGETRSSSAASRSCRSGARTAASSFNSVCVCADECLQGRPEAQRMLHRVKPHQDGKVRGYVARLETPGRSAEGGRQLPFRVNRSLGTDASPPSGHENQRRLAVGRRCPRVGRFQSFNPLALGGFDGSKSTASATATRCAGTWTDRPDVAELHGRLPARWYQQWGHRLRRSERRRPGAPERPRPARGRGPGGRAEQRHLRHYRRRGRRHRVRTQRADRRYRRRGPRGL